MKHFFYKYTLLFCLLFASANAFGQLGTYGNEWIDYSKTYYKFKVGAEGICRISKAALDAAGVPSTVAGAQLIMYRYGQEIAIYTSTTGTLGSGDYVEFFGTKNDGRQDVELYNQNQQLNDKMSLFSDTAVYYLTYDNQSSHLRYSQVTNSTPSGATPVPYCLYTTGVYYKNEFFPGKTLSSGYLFYSSQFDDGEGFINGQNDLVTVYPIGLTLTELQNSSGINARISTNITGVSNVTPHSVRVYLNNQVIADSTYGIGSTKKFNLSVPVSALSTYSEIKFQHYNYGTGYDKYGVAHVQIEYPRSFNVSGLSYFHFRLSANSGSQYLEFNNFNNGSAAPCLYDITNRKYYLADLSVSGKTRFYIDGSLADRDLVLYSNANAVTNLNAVKTQQFKNYSLAANQGNYIIMTHSALDVTTNGHNYISDYKAYRASVAGGSYNPVIVDVDDLYDQFAYGTTMHPLSIRHFLQFAYNTWAVKPKNVFFIGRGLLYYRYDQYLSAAPGTYPFPVIPVYGHPGSDLDFVNFLPGRAASMAVGRLSAWTPLEVSNYLEKIKDYEAVIPEAALPTASTELWKKNVLHLAGGGDAGLRQILKQNLDGGAAIIKDSAYGGIVTSIYKSSTDQVVQINDAMIDSMVNSGIGIITFHGHASAGGFDFNLNDPETYHSAPRLPLFVALGCDVAQIFEISNQRTISERYVNAINGGSIAMSASSTEGFTDFHGFYLKALYTMIGKKDYGTTYGLQFKDAYDSVNRALQTPYYFAHLEANFIQGDPAIKMFGPSKPDFYVSPGSISTVPYNVTTNLDSFKLKIVSYNLGLSSNDTLVVKLEHINPAGVTTLVGNYNVYKLYNTDTVLVNIPVDKLKDLGLNKYRVTIDAPQRIDETSELNNVATVEVFIYSDQLIPVYPQEFGIVGQQGVTLKASTINPFRGMARYRMELDTTESFNSPAKQTTSIASIGGVIKWQPSIIFKDSTVYYWRSAFDSSVNGNYLWSNSSFVYIPQSGPGWNQSHYFQYLQDNFDNETLDNDRIFRFKKVPGKIIVKNTIMHSDADVDYSKVNYNDNDIQRSGCYQANSLQILVFDSLTGKPWQNYVGHPSGANASCASNRGVYAFEFPLTSQSYRDKARRFLDSIPNGNYVLIKNVIFHPVYIPSPLSTWKADTLVYGSGNSVYSALKRIGFSLVDSVDGEKAYVFFTQKGNQNFTNFQEVVGNTSTEIINQEFDPIFYDTKGTLSSTIIGPAKEWTSLHWKGLQMDNAPVLDTMFVSIYGIDTLQVEHLLFSGTAKDTSLSFISASTYPKMRMEWTAHDSVEHQSPQLKYWRILFTPVPEAALNPNAYYSFTDSVQMGQKLTMALAIENLTAQPMDSMLVKYKIIDASGIAHDLGAKRYKPLAGNDSLQLNISINVDNYVGSNALYVEANPDNDQPEQYHPNNLGYLPFKVNKDLSNPLLDVTFDGVHILDKDIVSAKPFIKISLKDENQYLAIDDTSLLTVKLRYPNELVSQTIPFDGVTCKFIPANITSTGKNEAYIEYRPVLTRDSTYELTVSARDKTGNDAGGAGKTDYVIDFNVYNQAAITRVLNYPNPFSTATAFVFTLTGSEIPSQFKIQIMTVTGKVVREILKDELGPLHIGRNITDYKWDGKDEYGQMLGNGVYLYRVVTTINGNNLDKWTSATGAEDKYFTKGYGKMYIMR